MIDFDLLYISYIFIISIIKVFLNIYFDILTYLKKFAYLLLNYSSLLILR